MERFSILRRFFILSSFFLLTLLTPGYSFAKGGMDMGFILKSDAFKEGEAVPREYTCEGNDISPPLIWESLPEGTKSLAMIVEDPDAPIGTFTHWIIYDIPANLKGLESSVSQAAALPGGMKQGTNDFGKTGYGGPCPPRGHGRHRYYFILKALDVETLGIPPRSGKSEALKAAKGHVLAEAKLMGVFER